MLFVADTFNILLFRSAHPSFTTDQSHDPELGERDYSMQYDDDDLEAPQEALCRLDTWLDQSKDNGLGKHQIFSDFTLYVNNDESTTVTTQQQ